MQVGAKRYDFCFPFFFIPWSCVGGGLAQQFLFVTQAGGPSSGHARPDPFHTGAANSKLLENYPFFRTDAKLRVTDASFHFGAASIYSRNDTQTMFDSGRVSLMLFHPRLGNMKSAQDSDHSETLAKMEEDGSRGVREFQRACNFCCPLDNRMMSSEEAKVTAIVLAAFSECRRASSLELRAATPKRRKYS